VYNTNTLQLLASVPVDPPGGTGNLGSTSGEYREVMRYEFAPAGVTAGTNNEFYVYVSHYKASSGSSDDKARLGEATIIRSNEYLNLPANARVLYVGRLQPDDNSGEAGYQTICSNGVPGIANSATGQGQGVDPLNIVTGMVRTPTRRPPSIGVRARPAHNILFMLSEESYERRYRDDLQVMTSNVYYDVAGGLQYVPGLVSRVRQQRLVHLGNSVNIAGNTALNDLDPNLTKATGLTAAVLLEDLTGASDHLPIVADYTVLVPLVQVAPRGCFTLTNPAPLEVCVSDCSTSSSPEIGWEWLWGDGNSYYGSNPPCYTYASPGTYVLTQIVCNAQACCTNWQIVDLSTTFQGWQNWYFPNGGSLNANAGPTQDVYGTGMSNSNKFMAGFSGTNAAAYLHIISTAKSGTNVVLTYLGASGDTNYVPGLQSRTNVLDFTTGGASGNYTNGGWRDSGQTNILGVGLTYDGSGGTGLGTVTNMTDVGGATVKPSRYYRVRVLLP
jgi:hypothetical protein